MARYRHLDIITDIESIAQVTNQRQLVKRAVQASLDRVSSAWDWNYLWEWAFIATVAPYETGTVSINSQAAAVTGSGTTFTAAMVGRKIRFGSETAYYTIKSFTSTTSITLDQNYQGSSNLSASTYSIFKDEYRLAPDVNHYKVMRQIKNGVPMFDMNASDFDIFLPAPSGEGSPTISTFIGTKLDTYSTGTLSGTVNTSTLTGSGTSWTSVEGLGRGSRITVGSNVFTVKSVDSDTQLTIYETLSATIAASTAYSISLDNLRVQFYTIPDAAENIYYRYQRLPFPLVDDEDIPDMPDDWHWLLVEGGLSWTWAEKGDAARSDAVELRFRAGLQDMIVKMGYPSGNRIGRRKSMDSQVRFRAGIYPPQYDVRYSS